jgi:hypothetical protein
MVKSEEYRQGRQHGGIIVDQGTIDAFLKQHLEGKISDDALAKILAPPAAGDK